MKVSDENLIIIWRQKNIFVSYTFRQNKKKMV